MPTASASLTQNFRSLTQEQTLPAFWQARPFPPTAAWAFSPSQLWPKAQLRLKKELGVSQPPNINWSVTLWLKGFIWPFWYRVQWIIAKNLNGSSHILLLNLSWHFWEPSVIYTPGPQPAIKGSWFKSYISVLSTHHHSKRCSHFKRLWLDFGILQALLKSCADTAVLESKRNQSKNTAYLFSTVLLQTVQEAAGVGQPEGHCFKVISSFLKIRTNTVQQRLVGGIK